MSDTSTAADTSGAAAPEEPAPPSFSLGQLVLHEWEDDYHTEPQRRYGLVVEVPTEGNADVPEDEQSANYGVAWLAAGTASLPPADLSAI